MLMVSMLFAARLLVCMLLAARLLLACGPACCVCIKAGVT